MTRKKTDGERIAGADGVACLGDVSLVNLPDLADRIDRIIRRRMAEAYALGWLHGRRSQHKVTGDGMEFNNPYRGRKKK